MAAPDLETLTRPVSEAEPCGPDLDQADDPEFMNYMARAEGLLPPAFFTINEETGKEAIFDRSKIDFEAELKSIAKLVAATRDLRVMAVLAKLLVLQRDLSGFATCLAAMAALLEARWADVHPRPEDDGDASLRVAVLETLDDMPRVVLPLQYLPLVESRRLGSITFRSHLIATGEAKARQHDEARELTAIESAFMEADLAGLIATRDQVKAARGALARIGTACVEHGGVASAVRLERLPELVGRMLALLDGFIVKRDPSAVSAPAAEPAAAGVAEPAGARATALGPRTTATVPAGSIACAADAAQALAAVSAYFGRSEPSNPAALLVRKAEQLMGKSFMEVMRLLIPAHAEAATIHIGGEQAFALTVEQLSASAAPSEPAAPDTGLASNIRRLADMASPRAPPGSATKPLEANTRQDAIALLDQIGAFYRAMEPSSPIPLLTDRARDLSERDFLAILKDVLPGKSLLPSAET